MWYVIQVVGGREETAKRLIEERADPATFDEVFVPHYRASRKVNGEWEFHYPVLTPGYLICDTREIGAFEAQLRAIPAFMRLLGDSSGFKPLDRAERAWLEEWTSREDRVVQGSTGRIEKGRLKILSGPLLGREADVVKVNRRKKKAVVRMVIMGRPKEVTLELEIVGKTRE